MADEGALEGLLVQKQCLSYGKTAECCVNGVQRRHFGQSAGGSWSLSEPSFSDEIKNEKYEKLDGGCGL